MKVGGIHHVAIKAKDVERVASFYRDVLGLEPLDRHLDAQGGLRSIWLGAAGVVVMIERSATDAQEAHEMRTFAIDPPGLHLLAFTILPGDRQAWRDRLAARGLAIVHETRFTLYVQDPEGNRVGLSSYPAS